VQEILRVPDTLTRVPRTFEALEGVVNLRGQVLPVVDLRTRFGISRLARDERQRIVVLAQGGSPTGFVVDSVLEVLKVAGDDIDAAPVLTEEQARLLGRVANIERQKRMVLLVEPEHLLGAAEREAAAAACA
jgi:purine-binding chemotaxis protein CheW